MSNSRDRKWSKRRRRDPPKRLKVIKRLLNENLNSLEQEPYSSEANDYLEDVNKFLLKCKEHWPLMRRIGKEHPTIRKIVDELKQEGMVLIGEYTHRNW